nr:ABC transporter ATP-binding protein [Chthonobacter albigriseus]
MPDFSYERSIVSLLLRMLGGKRLTLVLVVVLGLLASAFEGVGLYLFLPLLDALDGPVDLSQLPGWLRAAVQAIPEGWLVPALVGLVLLSVIAKNAIGYLNAAVFTSLDTAAAHTMRREFYRSVLRASFGFLNGEPSGRIANALFSETWRAASALGVVYALITDATAAVILIAVLAYISWSTTLLVIPFVGLILVVLQLLTRQAKDLGRSATEANAALTKRGWEGLAGLKTIRLFGRESYELDRFAAASDTVRRCFRRMNLISLTIQPAFEVLIAFAVCTWIIVLHQTGTGLSTLAVFLLVLYRLQPKVRGIMSARIALLEHGSAVLEIDRLQRASAVSHIASGTTPIPRFRREIRFDKVGYSYPGSDTASLHEVDLTIRHNATTAVVGRSGAGKSTLLSLVCRHMDPTSGSITVDGIPLDELRLDDWYERIAVVTQEVHLFAATVRDNIAYGLVGATDADVVEAARLANADEFIRALPRGYDTEVGDRGILLSGGQRQRLAFARAIIRKPDLLILDEATNALDSYAESLIQDALRTIGSKATILIVAHRLSTVRDADEIVVLDAGRVVERGPYDQLIRRRGAFAEMMALQTKG